MARGGGDFIMRMLSASRPAPLQDGRAAEELHNVLLFKWQLAEITERGQCRCGGDSAKVDTDQFSLGQPKAGELSFKKIKPALSLFARAVTIQRSVLPLAWDSTWRML